MKTRLALAAALLAAAPVAAQPAPKQPAPAPKQPARQPPAATADDMAAFDKDLDALFSKGGLTSDQAAGRAAKASPTVRRRAAELEASIAQTEAAELARIPQVKGTASFTKLSSIDPVMFAPGVSIAFLDHSYVFEGQLAVPLSEYLVRFPKLIAAARAGTDAARFTQRSSEVNAGQDARLAYYEWVRSKLQVLIAQRQLTQVQRTLDQVRALAEVQRLSKADLMRVESQEAEAEQALDQLQNLSALREEQLRLLIGAPANEPLAIGEDIRTDITAPGPGQLDELVGTARKQRLEFRALDKGIDAKEKQRTAAKTDYYPKVSAVGVADYSDPNPRVFPQEDKFKFTWQVTAQVAWTLNDPLIERTTDHRLSAEASELRADRENLERGTRIEILGAEQAVAVATHALTTTQKGLAAAEESYRVRRELLNAERATAVDLVDTETDLTRARIAALNARVDLRVARAQLEHALGNDTK